MKMTIGYLGVALAALMVVGDPSSARGAQLFNQSFDVNADDWFDTGGSITQVASGGGTLGVTSAGGSAGHAEVSLGESAGVGLFTRFGTYRFDWPGQLIRQSLDVYIDPAAGNNGDGWYLDNAVSDNNNDNDGIADASDWREGGGVGALKATDGNWWITADADGASYQGPAAGGVGLMITTADWYTIVSDWELNGDGVSVDRNTYIYNSAGGLLYSDLNPQQVPLSGTYGMGGNRYGWLASTGQVGVGGQPLTLAIDNSILTTVVPEPSSFALAGFGLVGLAWFLLKRRDRPTLRASS